MQGVQAAAHPQHPPRVRACVRVAAAAAGVQVFGRLQESAAVRRSYAGPAARSP